jgi:hypothetical protein
MQAERNLARKELYLWKLGLMLIFVLLINLLD